MEVVLYLNDNLVMVENVKNSQTGEYINDATVQIFDMLDSDGNQVAGQSFPTACSYISGSNGRYAGTIKDTITVSLGSKYTVKVTADGGAGLRGYWEESLVVKTRRFSD
jgi:hypothetical protein